MKKIVFVVTTALTITGVQAHTSFKSGVVIGMGLGYSRMSGNIRENLFYAAIGAPTIGNGSFKTTPTYNGFVADLFAGYRWNLNQRFMLGCDLSFSKETNILKKSHVVPGFKQISTTTLQRTFSIIPAITAGYIMSNQWMVYGKLGLSISRFELNNQNLGTVKISTPEKTFTRLGLKEVLGVEYAMNDKASVFSEISLEQLPTMKATLKNPTVPKTIGATHDVKVKPRYFTAKLGVIFKI